MRILIAGFQHETNTFAPSLADWPAFQADTGFAAYARGDAMLQSMRGGDLPIGGFIRAAEPRGWTLVPSLWAGATPSAHVTRDAFERICAELLEDTAAALAAGPLDGVYLDLHGAAVAQHVDDCEGELLERLRALVGPALPIVVSLDLHANVTRRMLRHASALTAYRTYPHVDMPATGARAAALLAERLRPDAAAWATHQAALPFLIPLNAMCTLVEPARGLFERLEQIEAAQDVRLSFALGFPAADFDECGGLVFGHGPDAATVSRAVDQLAQDATARRAEWALDLLPANAAVERAIELAARADGAVVIADTQDNPGAGGDSNTTGVLRALLAAGAGRRFPGRVALGLLFDPAAAAAAHAAGLGSTLELSLGKAVRTFDGHLSDAPVTGRCTVRALSDGSATLTGPMRGSGHTRLGPSARVEIDGVQVLVTSAKAQMLDLALFRFLGVEPAAFKILVVKSSVHFRAAFAPVAAHILVAQAPGPMAADPADLPWTKLPATTARRP